MVVKGDPEIGKTGDLIWSQISDTVYSGYSLL